MGFLTSGCSTWRWREIQRDFTGVKFITEIQYSRFPKQEVIILNDLIHYRVFCFHVSFWPVSDVHSYSEIGQQQDYVEKNFVQKENEGKFHKNNFYLKENRKYLERKISCRFKNRFFLKKSSIAWDPIQYSLFAFPGPTQQFRNYYSLGIVRGLYCEKCKFSKVFVSAILILFSSKKVFINNILLLLYK